MRIIGIDSDSKGSIALLDTTAKTVVVWSIPATKKTLSDGGKRTIIAHAKLALIMAEAFTGGVDQAFIEEQWSRNNQSSTSTFTFGAVYGAIQQAVASADPDLDVKLIHSTTWKAAMRISADKDEAVALACKLVPNGNTVWRAKVSAAEALLIAVCGAIQLRAIPSATTLAAYTLTTPVKAVH